jgi:ABC-type phosphate transport system substrate-binding protein
MFARKLLTGLMAGSVAASVIGLTAGSASAVYAPDPDDLATGNAADLVGVGSDTSQVVLKTTATAFNATNPAVRIATYAATGAGTIAPPGGAEVNRPNGSGAGKSTLYGAGNNAGIDYARSSSALSTAEVAANLQQIPFAVDTLGTVTSTGSNAPASISRADLLRIYRGDVTNWSQLGGANGAIVPLIPQNGSGTRSFFLAQLQAENGGTAPTLAGTVTDFQENDDTQIRNNPNAIAPFSAGRAALLGTLRVEGGFSAQRALYNVVRGPNLGDAGVQAFFGPNGFLCSTDATDLITQAGFQQLAPASRGGVCGAATQIATTVFTTNAPQATSASLTGSSPAAGQVRLVAGVSAGTAPQGTFSFFEGTTQLAANVPLQSGQATVTLSATPGAHTYTARFVPAGGSVFRRSTATTTVTVSAANPAKVGSTLSESFPAKAKAKAKTKTVKGKKKTKVTVKPVTGAVTVALTGSTAKATGPVVVKLGSKTVGTGTLSNGVATLTLKGLKKGSNKLTATWAGDTVGNAGLLSFSIKAATKSSKGKKSKK